MTYNTIACHSVGYWCYFFHLNIVIKIKSMKLFKFFALIVAAATFVACDNNGGDGTKEPPKPDTNIVTIEAASQTVRIEQELAFTVKFNGEDVTAESTIYNAANNEVVSNPFVAPSESCEMQFYATYGFYESEPIVIEVVTGNDFNHRVLLVDHTGTGCPNCPNMSSMLHELAKTKYHLRYSEAAAHWGGYATRDPARSDAAAVVGGHFPVTGYPNLTYNFNHKEITSGYPTASTGVKMIQAELDILWKPAADAGIKINSALNGDDITVDVEVTSKVEQQYHVVAWLLEDNIYGQQSNGREEYHNYHNNCIRAISAGNSDDLSGDDMGVISADGIASKQLKLKAESGWDKSNLKVLVIVSAPSSAHDGKFEVVNTAVCPVNGSKDYEYR